KRVRRFRTPSLSATMVFSAAVGELAKGDDMFGTELATKPGGVPSVPAYTREAVRYDARTSRYGRYRKGAVELLPLASGDVVLQSAHAMDNVLAHVRDGGAVAATGGKWAPPWAVAVNAGVLALHAPFVRNFAGFHRPWGLLAKRVPELRVQEVALGAGYLA